jgi:rhamnogalacturonyl hydrolase YesR
MRKFWTLGLAAAALLGVIFGVVLASNAQAAALPAPPQILAVAEKVADWQIAHREDFSHIPNAGRETRSSRDWQQGAFYVGLTELADRSAEARFREAVITNGVRNDWRLGDRPFHADDQIIGQSYLWAASHGAPAEATAALRQRLEAIVAANPQGALSFEIPGGCQQRWCWSDALFMAPPTWLRAAKSMNTPAMADYAHREFKATTDFLFDPDEHLYYRDSRFFTRRDENGKKLFWSRGNGWAFAGLARIIQTLPAEDPHRAYYVGLFRQMAAKLKTIQKPDGYWSPSLLADPEKTPAESSGTGFFTYGLAWGINAGLLDRKEYLPAVEKGWAALTRAVHPDGKLGWVQQVSDRPDAVAYEDTQFYGVGAFLLAASAVYDLQKAVGGK